MRRISFAQRFIAYLCCLSLNVPVLAQAHTIGPIPVERAPLPLPAPESKPVPPPVTKPVNTPMPAPVHVPAESETAGRRKKEIYYIHTDHLNTPRAITNGEQKKVWRWGNVDPFGKNTADENPEGRGRFAFNLRFPGQYYDRETGLHYNWHRDYDPGIGRYVQSDPIGLMGGMNIYQYVNMNPIMYTDQSGLFSWLLLGGVLTIGMIGSLSEELIKQFAKCFSFDTIEWDNVGIKAMKGILLSVATILSTAYILAWTSAYILTSASVIFTAAIASSLPFAAALMIGLLVNGIVGGIYDVFTEKIHLSRRECEELRGKNKACPTK